MPESNITNPWDSPKWLTYFSSLKKRFGYFRFSGIGTFSDDPNIAFEDLYVPQYLKGRKTIWQELSRHKSLLVLGTAGAGKSTLITHAILSLISRRNTQIAQKFGNLIPLPIVLREISAEGTLDAAGLITQFLTQSFVPDGFTVTEIQELLSSGNALLLLDGVDELGNKSIQTRVRQGLEKLRHLYPDCLVLTTSRESGIHAFRETSGPANEESKGPFVVRRLANFDDAQIKLFCRNWYATKEPDESLAAQSVNELVNAIHQNEGTRELAKIPNLLTMMALIHKKLAMLPDGRAMLFDAIADAYLEHIDRQKGIVSPRKYSLKEKKRILSALAYEMHLSSRGQRQVVATKEKILSWLNSQTLIGGEQDAEQFLDHVVSRSGLLVCPWIRNGIEVYSFVHLSMQEYFAAYYIRSKVTSISWLKSPSQLGLSDQQHWQSPILFLYEVLFNERDDWSDFFPIITDNIFPRDQQLSEHQAQLLVELICDEYSGFNASIDEFVERLIAEHFVKEGTATIDAEFHKLAISEKANSLIWGKLVAECDKRKVENLKVSDDNTVPADAVFRSGKSLELNRAQLQNLSSSFPNVDSIYATKSKFLDPSFLEQNQYTSLQLYDTNVALGDWIENQSNLTHFGVSPKNSRKMTLLPEAIRHLVCPQILRFHLHDFEVLDPDLIAQFAPNTTSFCGARSSIENFEFLKGFSGLKHVTLFPKNEEAEQSLISVMSEIESLESAATDDDVLTSVNKKRSSRGFDQLDNDNLASG